MKRELLELRTKLSKQERLLQNTAEHLRTATRQKESLEQFIFSQCGCLSQGGGQETGLPDSLVLWMDSGQRGWGRGD